MVIYPGTPLPDDAPRNLMLQPVLHQGQPWVSRRGGQQLRSQAMGDLDRQLRTNGAPEAFRAPVAISHGQDYAGAGAVRGDPPDRVLILKSSPDMRSTAD